MFDPTGKFIKDIGVDEFTTVMNEISYCPENGKIYIPEYAEKIWEIDGVNGEVKLIIKDLPIGDHRNGGITCKDGYLYFALGFPSNTGFRRSRQPRLDRHPERSVLGQAPRTASAPRRTTRSAATSSTPASTSSRPTAG